MKQLKLKSNQLGFLGFISKALGLSDGGDSARDASSAQVAAADKAIAFQKESRDLARKDLEPFKDAGVNALPGLTSLIQDPNAQKDFVQDNPFFKSLADESQKRIFDNGAARGKVGSGGTAEALQNSLMLLGNDLVNQSIGQRFSLANIGQSSAAGQANITTNAGNNISDLHTQSGNAQAAGIIGAENSRVGGIESLINAGTGIFGAYSAAKLSDKNFKEDIIEVGSSKGIKYYFYKYKGSLKLEFGVMAQEVEHIKNAVLNMGGKKYVNYGALTCR